MRLLNTSTLQLEEVFESRLPKYAILSHRWEEEEVSFHDMELRIQKKRKGWSKIFKFCTLVSSAQLQYVWVDTCCIDKNSSAELSEAINSMYRWYRNAEVCFAYLSDVFPHRDHDDQQFTSSAWFKRGWTLQELLAPKKVHFYNRYWEYLGNKGSLVGEIQKATNIHIEALKGRHLRSFPVAIKMSWAAGRCTTRIEDKAYSLMGLFDVNMPMLYGEGEKAFIRLQEEIIKISDDHSIFAWSGVPDSGSGLLAASPDAFSPVRVSDTLDVKNRSQSSYSLTNKGLSIDLKLSAVRSTLCYYAMLECKSVLGHQLALYVRRLNVEGQYVRVRVGGSDLQNSPTETLDDQNLPRTFRRTRLNVRQQQYALEDVLLNEDSIIQEIHNDEVSPVGRFRLPMSKLFKGRGGNIDEPLVIEPDGIWDAREGIVQLYPETRGRVMSLDFSQQSHIVRKIEFGFSGDMDPIFFVITHNERRVGQPTLYDSSTYKLDGLELKSWSEYEDDPSQPVTGLPVDDQWNRTTTRPDIPISVYRRDDAWSHCWTFKVSRHTIARDFLLAHWTRIHVERNILDDEYIWDVDFDIPHVHGVRSSSQDY